MAYNWWVFLHLIGVLGFLGAHGVSMVVLYRVRKERDRAKLEQLVSFSGTTTRPMYIALGVLLIGGVAAGIVGKWFSYWWIWGAIGVLLVTTGLMTAIARPWFSQITEACGVRPTGVPRKSDEELDQILRGPTFLLINLTGTIGLLVILYLMVFKPGVG
jgi:cytochrome bd-type quinol oxidase subunit 2